MLIYIIIIAHYKWLTYFMHSTTLHEIPWNEKIMQDTHEAVERKNLSI